MTAFKGGQAVIPSGGGAGSDQFIFLTGDSNLLGYDSVIDFALEDYLVLAELGDTVVNDRAIDITFGLTLSDAADLAATGDGQ